MKSTNPRTDYREGQLLRAQDLQQDVLREIHLRRQHNAYWHTSWGIARGLKVELTEDRLRVAVSLGLAYDGRGRELLVAETVELNLPPDVPSILVVYFNEKPAVGIRGAIDCVAEVSKRLQGRPLFAWRRPRQVLRGVEIPLTCVHGHQVSARLSAGVRHYATPVRRPFIIAGRTSPGAPWQRRELSAEHESRLILSWSLRVDTSQAGFAFTPHYFASLAKDLFADGAASTSMAGSLLGAFTSICDAKKDAFTFVVLFGITGPLSPPPFDKPPPVRHLFEHDPPSVAWVAVEPVKPCGSAIGPPFWLFAGELESLETGAP